MMGDELDVYITKRKTKIENNSFKTKKTKIISDNFFFKNIGIEKKKGDKAPEIAEISCVKQEYKGLILKFQRENSNFVVLKL